MPLPVPVLPVHCLTPGSYTTPQLNFRVQWFHLKDAFAEAGEVTYANVITGEDGRSKGFGVVEFNNAKDAQRAIGECRATQLAWRAHERAHDAPGC